MNSHVASLTQQGKGETQKCLFGKRHECLPPLTDCEQGSEDKVLVNITRRVWTERFHVQDCARCRLRGPPAAGAWAGRCNDPESYGLRSPVTRML